MRTIETGTPNLRAEVEHGIGVITFDRPERRNALTTDMFSGLSHALADMKSASDVRCVVLTGAGGAFSAGGDVKSFAERGGAGATTGTFEDGVNNQRASHHATSGELFKMPKPTLAVLGGPAAGAGLSLALACDMRVAIEGTVMTTAFAKVGLAGDYGGTWFMTQLLGPARTKELYFLSDRIDMETALRLGLVNRVFPADSFEAAWREFATQLAAGPPIAHMYMKENINRAVTGALETTLDIESTAHRRSAMTEDHLNASKAFVAKETPVFEGR